MQYKNRAFTKEDFLTFMDDGYDSELFETNKTDITQSCPVAQFAIEVFGEHDGVGIIYLRFTNDSPIPLPQWAREVSSICTVSTPSAEEIKLTADRS